jgi:hypothetical protein
MENKQNTFIESCDKCGECNECDFGQVPKFEKVRTTIYIPCDLHKLAKIYCANNGTSLTALLTEFLEGTVRE